MSLAERFQTRYCRIKQNLIRTTYRSRISPLNTSDHTIVETLERTGVYVSALSELIDAGIDVPAGLFDQARDLLSQAKPRVSESKDFTTYVTEEAIAANPMLLFWGLNERLLDIVENYIRMPVAYRGLVARRDFSDGKQTDTRMWHLDGEDSRSLKIIVYLNDVSTDGGPFTFVSKKDSPAIDGNDLVDGRIPDSVMDELVQPAHQIQCTGPAGTVVFVDTCSVFHKGAVPVTSDRMSVFYAYNSKCPLQPQYCSRLFSTDQLPVGRPLTVRQKNAIDFE